MKTRHKILPAVCCISMLSACASNQAVSVAPFTIKPMTAINTKQKPESFYQIGRYYQGQNRYEQAIEAYQKALAIDNNFVEARNGLGVIFSRQGKYNEAIAAFKSAIQQAPKAAHLYSNMGYAYYLQGQYTASVTALVQATSLDPNNQHALNNLGMAYAKAGRNVESMQAFSQAIATESLAVTSTATLPANLANTTSDNTFTGNTSAPTVLAVAQPSTSAVETPVMIAVVSAVEVESLALPKNRGVIKPAFVSVPIVESNTKLVQLKPHVSELQIQRQKPILMTLEPTLALAASDENVSLAKLKLEVANGNGINGMAGKVGQFLHAQGFRTARLTNQKPFHVRMTQIQYRAGYQAEAQFLQANLPEAAELVQQNNMRADIGIRLLLGKDVATRTAYFDGKTTQHLVALN